MSAIKQSVGKKGVNDADDVRVIQDLLSANSLDPKLPGTEYGEVDDQTIAAIKQFQETVVKLSRGDGRVDPWGKTFLYLCGIQSPDTEALVGAIFAESSAKKWHTKRWSGGDDADEKEAIAATIINAAYYARTPKIDGKTCSNATFGSGTLLSAIQRIVVAYNQDRWNLVMTGNRLKSGRELAQLKPDDAEHLELSIDAVGALDDLQGPKTVAKLANRAPVGFNRAEDLPPYAPRMEKIGEFASHSFYGFKPGRECQ